MFCVVITCKLASQLLNIAFIGKVKIIYVLKIIKHLFDTIH